MQLALNYSPPAAQLIQSGQIHIDFFKTPDWEWMIHEAQNLRPVAVHYTLEAGNHCHGQVDWNRLDQVAQITGTPFINLHLDSKQSYFPWLSVDTTHKSDIDPVIKVILSDVMMFVDRFGSDRIIIENSAYHGDIGNTLRLCVEPDLITRVVEETGCGLLLDISHAVITAKQLGKHPFEYLSQLPFNKIKELHFAGIHHIKGRWIDHLSILKRDWHWLHWVLTRFQSSEWHPPWLLAFEYGGVGPEFEWRCEPKILLEQIPILCERVKRI